MIRLKVFTDGAGRVLAGPFALDVTEAKLTPGVTLADLEDVQCDEAMLRDVDSLADLRVDKGELTHDTAARDAARAERIQVEQARDARRVALAAEAKADAFIEVLRSATPAEIRAWVTANVTDLASARIAIARLAVAVAYALGGGKDR